MKYNYLKNMLVVLSILFFAACDNAEYKAKNNSLYFVDATDAKAASLTMEDGVDVSVAVRLAQKMTEDVEVEVIFNPDLLTSYNAENGTKYLSLSADKLPENVKVTIPAGTISGEYTFHIDNFETDGLSYAVPVQLGNVMKGNVSCSNAQGKFIYLLNKPLIVSVPVFNGSVTAIKAEPAEENWGLKPEQWTIETWIYMNGFTKNNQMFFQAGNQAKRYEIYIRYGDANKPYNYLQVKLFGGQVETKKELIPNVWYHWAFVWDGTMLTVYRNGEKDLMLTPPALAEGINFDYFRFAGAMTNQCKMSQIRLWNVARSQNEIKNNMAFGVNPKDKKLIGYWPLEKAENDTFKDITGNGHDASIPANKIIRWEENVRFDGK